MYIIYKWGHRPHNTTWQAVSETPLFYTAGFVTGGHLHAGGVGNISVEAFDLL